MNLMESQVILKFYTFWTKDSLNYLLAFKIMKWVLLFYSILNIFWAGTIGQLLG